MTLYEIFVAFKAPIYILVGWVFAVWLTPKFFVDNFRQRMFALRDEVFSAAANGLIPFDHPAYGMLRSTMNGFIRYAHRLTLSHSLILMWQLRNFSPIKESTFKHRWNGYMSSIDKDSRIKLNGYRKRMDALVIRQVVMGSPILIATLVPWLIALLLTRFAFSWLVRIFNNPVQSLDETAMAFGQA